MSDIKDFKDPRVGLRYCQDPGLSEEIHTHCLLAWEEANLQLVKEGKLVNQSECLTGLISGLLNILEEIYGVQSALIVLDALSKNIRTSERYKKDLQ